MIIKVAAYYTMFACLCLTSFGLGRLTAPQSRGYITMENNTVLRGFSGHNICIRFPKGRVIHDAEIRYVKLTGQGSCLFGPSASE